MYFVVSVRNDSKEDKKRNVGTKKKHNAPIRKGSKQFSKSLLKPIWLQTRSGLVATCTSLVTHRTEMAIFEPVNAVTWFRRLRLNSRLKREYAFLQTRNNICPSL